MHYVILPFYIKIKGKNSLFSIVAAVPIKWISKKEIKSWTNQNLIKVRIQNILSIFLYLSICVSKESARLKVSTEFSECGNRPLQDVYVISPFFRIHLSRSVFGCMNTRGTVIIQDGHSCAFDMLQNMQLYAPHSLRWMNVPLCVVKSRPRFIGRVEGGRDFSLRRHTENRPLNASQWYRDRPIPMRSRKNERKREKRKKRKEKDLHMNWLDSPLRSYIADNLFKM